MKTFEKYLVAIFAVLALITLASCKFGTYEWPTEAPFRAHTPKVEPAFGTNPQTGENVAGLRVWWDALPNVRGYEIDRRCAAGLETRNFAVVSYPDTVFFDARAPRGTAFSYRVRAFNGADTGVSSEWTALRFAFPAVITGLTATAVSPLHINRDEVSRIDLLWEPVEATQFYVYRSTTNNPNTLTTAQNRIATISGAARRDYQDIGLSPNTTYFYWVKAVMNDTLVSEFSNMASARTLLAPPRNVQVEIIANDDVRITWDEGINGGAVGYEVFFETSRLQPTHSWLIADGSLSGRTVIDTGFVDISVGATIIYAVRAIAEDGTKGDFATGEAIKR
ncbi:MAG: hypothetical protein FWE23_04460 [Chitinivibrionia bacterium]|nr:hypothetical protein [Chitinivibrionia bacterium]